MSPKKKLPRTLRRESERASEKLAQSREKLAALEPGGRPGNPIDVTSSAVIEVHAAAMPCARCGESVRVIEHTAETVDAVRLRVVRVQCRACGARRAVYFRIGTTLPN